MSKLVIDGWLLWLFGFFAMCGMFWIVKGVFNKLSEWFDFWGLLTRLPWFNEENIID